MRTLGQSSPKVTKESDRSFVSSSTGRIRFSSALRPMMKPDKAPDLEITGAPTLCLSAKDRPRDVTSPQYGRERWPLPSRIFTSNISPATRPSLLFFGRNALFRRAPDGGAVRSSALTRRTLKFGRSHRLVRKSLTVTSFSEASTGSLKSGDASSWTAPKPTSGDFSPRTPTTGTKCPTRMFLRPEPRISSQSPVSTFPARECGVISANTVGPLRMKADSIIVASFLLSIRTFMSVPILKALLLTLDDSWRPARLVFIFDVSGSVGRAQLDYRRPNHQRK